MSRLAILCTPDTPALAPLAQKIAAGALANGAAADLLDAAADPSAFRAYDAAAFGLGEPATQPEFLAYFSRSLPCLAGKKISFFGGSEADRDFADSLSRIGTAARCKTLPAAFAEADAEALGRSLVHPREPRPDLAGTVPIIFSTITGNAYKLAAAAAEAVPDHVGPYNIRYITDEVIDKFDTFVLSYWCNHGTADDDTIDLISRMRGKKLIVIGSLGVATDTAHAASVCKAVTALASEHNTLLGHYLCRGSIDLRRTFARTRIPEGQKGHLSAERFEKQKQSLGHPNAEELAGARAAVAAFLAKA